MLMFNLSLNDFISAKNRLRSHSGTSRKGIRRPYTRPQQGEGILRAKTLVPKTDSEVITGEVEKEYIAQEPELVKYLATVRALERRF